MKRDREQYFWIIRWLLDHDSADVCDSEFHDAFATYFHVKQNEKLWGAQPSPLAMRRLAAMYRDGDLKRCRVGLTQMGGMGFPTWVYSYSLKHPRDWEWLKDEQAAAAA